MVLTASSEQLVKLAYKSVTDKSAKGSRRLGLKSGQFICAIGFNRNIEALPDVISVLGFKNYEDLAHQRNEIFANDSYQQLSLNDVLAIYAEVVKNPKMLSVMQYLMANRLESIESRIEQTVSSSVIAMRSIFSMASASSAFR